MFHSRRANFSPALDSIQTRNNDAPAGSHFLNALGTRAYCRKDTMDHKDDFATRLQEQLALEAEQKGAKRSVTQREKTPTE